MEEKQLDERLEKFTEYVKKNMSEISEKNTILDSVIYVIDFSKTNIVLDKN